jgi:cytochrome c6
MKLKLFAVAACLLMTQATAVFADDAAALFKSKCAMCHGATGAGDTPIGKSMGIKDLAAPEVQGKSDADLAKVISDGYKKMPAFKSSLSGAQVSDLVKFIRTLKK